MCPPHRLLAPPTLLVFQIPGASPTWVGISTAILNPEENAYALNLQNHLEKGDRRAPLCPLPLVPHLGSPASLLLGHTPRPFPRARTQQPHGHARLLPVCLAKTVGLAFFLARDQENHGEEMAN